MSTLGREHAGPPGPLMFPPVLEVLLRLDDPPTIAQLAPMVDWAVACRVAEHHRLLGRLDLAVTSADADELLPDGPRNRLREHRRAWEVAHGRRIGPQLRELAQHLAEADIDAVVLKGIALVTTGTVRGDLRPVADLDLLVSADDYGSTVEVLTKLGYLPHQLRPNRPDASAVRFDRHYHGPPYRHPARPLPIEVHWQLMSASHRLWFDPASLHRRSIELGDGVTIGVLDPPDQLAHLALHFWYDRELGRPAALGQLWDIRELVARMSGQALRETLDRASRRGHGEVLAAVLAVERLLLDGADIAPPESVDRLLKDRRTASFSIRRVLTSRPDRAQLLMVTPDVDQTFWRILTRLTAHLRRDQWELAQIHGPAHPLALRYLQWRMVSRLLAGACRHPRATLDELRLDRWARRLR